MTKRVTYADSRTTGSGGQCAAHVFGLPGFLTGLKLNFVNELGAML